MKSKKARSLIRRGDITYIGYNGCLYRDDRAIKKSAALEAIKIAEQEAEERVRVELTRWRDPNVELPDDGQEVLCVTKRRCNTFSVLQHDNYGWWQYIPFEGGGWCEYDGEVIGWREIHDTESSGE